jgi:hypothetical protein
MNYTKKHAKRESAIDNMLPLRHLSIRGRVPVASKQVPVGRLHVLMSRPPVPVASRQVLMASEFNLGKCMAGLGADKRDASDKGARLGG